jgi:hypothetical protein
VFPGRMICGLLISYLMLCRQRKSDAPWQSGRRFRERDNAVAHAEEHRERTRLTARAICREPTS